MIHKTMRAIAVATVAILSVNVGFTKVLPPPVSSHADSWSYADVAGLFADAPIVLRARITEAIVIKGAGGPAGTTRFYVEANATVLIRGSQGVPPKLAWVIDVAPDSRGKLPKLKGADVLLAARPVPGQPGFIQLLTRDAQPAWSPALETRVRAIVAAAAQPDAPPVISGISSVFHSPGTVIGEGETQIFLATADRSPVSISVLSRPGETRRWAFAQGEIVDEAARPPARDTLAWYRLACTLPASLPDASLGELAPGDAEAARADYAFVLQALGPCTRTRQK